MSGAERESSGFGKHVRTRLVSGLLVLIPLAITLFILMGNFLTMSGVADGLFKALRILLHIGPVWLLLQVLHRADHIAALDRPIWLVWLLMVLDALVVGQMASLAATGLHHGYRGEDACTEPLNLYA